MPLLTLSVGASPFHVVGASPFHVVASRLGGVLFSSHSHGHESDARFVATLALQIYKIVKQTLGEQ